MCFVCSALRCCSATDQLTSCHPFAGHAYTTRRDGGVSEQVRSALHNMAKKYRIKCKKNGRADGVGHLAGAGVAKLDQIAPKLRELLQQCQGYLQTPRSLLTDVQKRVAHDATLIQLAYRGIHCSVAECAIRLSALQYG